MGDSNSKIKLSFKIERQYEYFAMKSSKKKIYKKNTQVGFLKIAKEEWMRVCP